MHNKSIILVFFSILVVIMTIACIDNSVKNIDDSVVFNPSYSLPIGLHGISMEDIFNTTEYLPIDTSIVGDSIGYFWYDSVFYGDTLGFYDSTLVQDFSFSIINDSPGTIKSLMLRLNVRNGFPTDVFVQLYFSNGNNEVLDSLFDSGLLRIGAAIINEEGLVVDPTVLRNFDTYLDETEIDMLQQVQRLLLYVRINTSQQDVDYVRLYPNYRIDLHLALRVELEVN